MRKIVVAVLSALASLLGPSLAHADEDFFLVDTTSDSGALNGCVGGTPADCSLRGAFANADDGDPGTDTDSIVFLDSIFDGVEGTPGDATVVLSSGLTSDENLNLGTSCSTTNPCAGIDGPSGDNAIGVVGGTFSMNGVAIFGIGAAGIFKGIPSGQMNLTNNYFGLKLDGTVGASAVGARGVSLSDGNAQLGGVGTTPNFFAGLGTGLQIFTADDVTVQGNVFGVLPNGTVAANAVEDIELRSNIVNDGPQDITIGATPNLSTPACDDGCNVIAAAGPGSAGISFSTQGTDPATANVEIVGNHIGLSQSGADPIGDGDLVALADADDVSVSQNAFAGGTTGVSATAGASGPGVTQNTFGLSTGSDPIQGPSGRAISIEGAQAAPALVQGNSIADDGGVSIELSGSSVTVDENDLGIPGTADSGGRILAFGADHVITENSIDEVDAVGVLLDDVTGTTVSGNRIGLEGPVGEGIVVSDFFGDSTGNVIGGQDDDTANRIEAADGNAIRILGDGSDANSVLANSGTSSSIFLDLQGTVGPGNGPTGPNAGIEEPKVQKVKEKEVKGKGEPGAEVWIFRSRSDKKEVPLGLKKLLGTKSVKNDGTWKFKPDKKIKKKHVITALQTSELGDSSELSKGKKQK